MYEEYREQNKSDIADVKNSGGRPAGTITAGWFLREFAEGYPWAHLDVAGTAYSDTDAPPLPKGPAGVPTRLFVEFLLGRAR
jgi:leucyl aminopeptidase